MVPHEEYETSISPFDDDMIREPYYLHFQQHSLSHYDDTHPHGCTYGIPLIHLETHDFHCSFPSPFDVGGNPSHTWVKIHMIKGHYIYDIILHAFLYGLRGDLLTWRIIWDLGIIFCFIGFNYGGNKQHWRVIHHLRR